MIDPTDIHATFTPPADRRHDDDDWNWADAATRAWLDAARDAGLVIDAEDYDYHGDSVAGRVMVDSAWYDLEVSDSNRDEVRAVPAPLQSGQWRLDAMIREFRNEQD